MGRQGASRGGGRLRGRGRDGEHERVGVRAVADADARGPENARPGKGAGCGGSNVGRGPGGVGPRQHQARVEEVVATAHGGVDVAVFLRARGLVFCVAGEPEEEERRGGLCVKIVRGGAVQCDCWPGARKLRARSYVQAGQTEKQENARQSCIIQKIAAHDTLGWNTCATGRQAALEPCKRQG